ncbi:MAG: protease modulator HflC [Gammaproteobacteria bacterium]|nr:protease modulator HflC [Gammaproteobacteria bacterium]
MNTLIRTIVALVILAVLGVTFCFFTVDETEHAVRFRFSRIITDTHEPGWHLKYPWDRVLKLDKRLLTLDDNPSEFMTNQREKVFVDFFVKWRIAKPGEYYRATSGNERVVTKRLLDTVEDGLKDEFAKRELHELVSVERSEVMQTMTREANIAADKYGAEIIDVRIKRIDLSKTVSDAVYQRMNKEREREAKQRRAEGNEEAERIQSVADKDRTVILANAYREAQEIRGDGDATAAAIYAQAYTQDPEFYSFHRSMEAYRNSLGNTRDVMLIQPDSEFFKYFNQANTR